MSEDEEFIKTLFFNQMNDFENNTAKEIIKILDEKEYILESEVLGLITTARALIVLAKEDADTKKALLDTAIYVLEEGKKHISEQEQ